MPITAYCFDGRGDEPLAPSLGSPFADFWDILAYGGKGFADLCGFEIANVIWRHIYEARHIRPKPFFFWGIKIKTGTQFFFTGQRFRVLPIPFVQQLHFIIRQAETNRVICVCVISLCPELPQIIFLHKIVHNNFMLYGNDPPSP